MNGRNFRRLLAPAALILAGCAAGPAVTAEPAPPAGFQKVSDLVALPEFIPGLGALYVDPATLPAGPFAAYNRDGALVSTVYMIPTERLEAQASFDDLPTVGDQVRSVDLYFNAGHPGVEAPHYHVVLWHAAKAEAHVE